MHALLSKIRMAETMRWQQTDLSMIKFWLTKNSTACLIFLSVPRFSELLNHISQNYYARSVSNGVNYYLVIDDAVKINHHWLLNLCVVKIYLYFTKLDVCARHQKSKLDYTARV